MFVPKLIWKQISKISFKTSSSGARIASLNDIKTWVTSANSHTKMVLKSRINNKLMREETITKMDLKKLERLYNGWGKKDYEKATAIKREARNLIAEKARYFNSKETELKNITWEWQCRVYKKTDLIPFRSLMNIKKMFIEETWTREKRQMSRKLNWLKESGGMKINELYKGQFNKTQRSGDNRKNRDKIYCPTDEEITNLIGDKLNVKDPEIYGQVQVNSREIKILKLPPTFAVNEQLNIPELDLELKRAAIKGRWSKRSAENDEGLSQSQIKENQVKDVIRSSHWLKGGNEVDFTGVRPTSMKYNSSYILPGPIQDKIKTKKSSQT